MKIRSPLALSLPVNRCVKKMLGNGISVSSVITILSLARNVKNWI